MIDDAILSKEAAYIFQNAIGFEPVDGNLTRWRGIVQDSSGNAAELLIELPSDFPHLPPKLSLPQNTQHPTIDDNGLINTRTISRWTSNNHVFEVIREAKSVIASAPFAKMSSVRPAAGQEIGTLSNQLSTLKSQLAMKKHELDNIRQQSAAHVVSEVKLEDVMEDALINLQNEAYGLEDAYDNLEIKAIDFAKNFVENRKRYYTVRDAMT